MKIPESSHVMLKPGGLLVFRDWKNTESDVSERAAEYLCEMAVLDEKVTLRDAFLLLKHSPLLQQVFHRFWAEELINDAFFAEADPYTGAYHQEGIEYLELSRNYRVDLHTRTCELMQRFSLHGIGFVLREPMVIDGQEWAAGTRQEWSMLAASASTYLNYPLRLKEISEVWVEDGDDGNRSMTIEPMDFGPPSLLEILHGILYELSFFGAGDHRENSLALLLEEQEWSEPITIDEMIASLQEEILRAEADPEHKSG